ncbi:Kelch repeat-containing protein [Myxococcus fulvus]|uniref:Kelch repeat-containing protein n=1 Tax=Myxococcus fulvus TaxID=33 RepID=UPI003B9CC8FC
MKTGTRFVMAAALVLGVQAIVSCIDVEERTERFCQDHPAICDGGTGTPDGGSGRPDAGDAGDAGEDGGPDAGDAGHPRWAPAGTLSDARTGHTATLLPDGRVLVTGGFAHASGSGALATVEVYDSADGGSWTTLAPLTEARGDHTATEVSGGMVLVVGGRSGSVPTKSVELFDPSTGGSSQQDLAIAARASHGAVLLPGTDQVLVMGGGGNAGSGFRDSASYSVSGGTWSTSSGAMRLDRNVLSVTLVGNRVFAVGGYGESGTQSSYDVYTPGQGWNATSGTLGERRHAHAAAEIGAGALATQLLVTGGKRTGDANTANASSEVIPTAVDGGTASTPADDLFDARFAHTATTLKSGDVLVVGGTDVDGDSLSTVELFDASLLQWGMRPTLTTPRAGHTATRLPDGSVLVIGGHGSSGAALRSAERYWP